ncbi:MAG: hypothetical protein J7J15_00255 [Candidatus Aenigmarchaeota archaeon]|nr:hypothetical protein [Candidatus Aenigmarchaeota archaeon]
MLFANPDSGFNKGKIIYYVERTIRDGLCKVKNEKQNFIECLYIRRKPSD